MTDHLTPPGREALLRDAAPGPLASAADADVALLADLLAAPATWAELDPGLEDTVVQARCGRRTGAAFGRDASASRPRRLRSPPPACPRVGDRQRRRGRCRRDRGRRGPSPSTGTHAMPTSAPSSPRPRSGAAPAARSRCTTATRVPGDARRPRASHSCRRTSTTRRGCRAGTAPRCRSGRSARATATSPCGPGSRRRTSRSCRVTSSRPTGSSRRRGAASWSASCTQSEWAVRARTSTSAV